MLLSIVFLTVLSSIIAIIVVKNSTRKKENEQFEYLQIAVREGVRHARLTASNSNKVLTIDEKRHLALEDAKKVAERAGVQIPLDQVSAMINSIITD